MLRLWAVGLKFTQGFTKPIPIVLTAISLALSMGLLGWSVKSLPLGTAYAVWTGIGATATVAFGIATGAESASLTKVLLVIALVGCIVGLRVVSE